jgi:DNA end-binding protein Ku
LDDLAERGRALFDRLSREGDVKAASTDVDQARQGLLGVITAVRHGATNAIGRTKAAATLSTDAAVSVADATGTVAREVSGTRHDARLEDHTKAELYELATARDIDGRSSMSKNQLVKALRS